MLVLQWSKVWFPAILLQLFFLIDPLSEIMGRLCCSGSTAVRASGPKLAETLSHLPLVFSVKYRIWPMRHGLLWSQWWWSLLKKHCSETEQKNSCHNSAPGWHNAVLQHPHPAGHKECQLAFPGRLSKKKKRRIALATSSNWHKIFNLVKVMPVVFLFIPTTD